MAILEYSDTYYMQKALIQAQNALSEGEVPIGCIIVCNDKIIAQSYNMTQRLNDPTAHAEIIAITTACQYLNNKYLNNCTLYVTLEPCLMCSGAIFWSHISKVVYGATDPKSGYSLFCQPFNSKTKVQKGIMEEECNNILKFFFQKHRR